METLKHHPKLFIIHTASTCGDFQALHAMPSNSLDGKLTVLREGFRVLQKVGSILSKISLYAVKMSFSLSWTKRPWPEPFFKVEIPEIHRFRSLNWEFFNQKLKENVGRFIEYDYIATPAFISHTHISVFLSCNVLCFAKTKSHWSLCFSSPSSTVTSCKLRLISINAFQFNLKLQYV